MYYIFQLQFGQVYSVYHLSYSKAVQEAAWCHQYKSQLRLHRNELIQYIYGIARLYVATLGEFFVIIGMVAAVLG